MQSNQQGVRWALGACLTIGLALVAPASHAQLNCEGNQSVVVERLSGNPRTECRAVALMFGIEDLDSVSVHSKVEGLPGGTQDDILFNLATDAHIVFVKAGRGGHAYFFPEGTTNGAGQTLSSVKDVSHVTFCYAPVCPGSVAAVEGDDDLVAVVHQRVDLSENRAN